MLQAGPGLLGDPEGKEGVEGCQRCKSGCLRGEKSREREDGGELV